MSKITPLHDNYSHSDSAKRNSPYGVCGLDLNSQITSAQIPLIVGKTKTGNYTGDGNPNVAVAHGLGYIPKMLLIVRRDATAGMIQLFETTGYLFGSGVYTATAWTSSNFYVTDTMNTNLAVFDWVAIG